MLLNPTVPILYEGSGVNDDYIPQLVASVDAAVDHLVETGVADPGRIAVAGRSYGAFSSANLLIHSRRFVHALVGEGVPVRYVELPYEGHHYWARESVLHAAAEMIDWLNCYIGPNASPPK